ncbi:hypothetical protein NUM_35050 [Actinocatenispora comari]|jgi:hypothetical protein|uniref:Uncharacterized protein n=2 Tax=Actinocatenispora comari TaxID=2807577 RepID=A0A8J4EL94_9ACTN|nr:hypothetical protein NUM_35050 [Actinocatenispora comari]
MRYQQTLATDARSAAPGAAVRTVACEALFASELPLAGRLAADEITAAIRDALRLFGRRGCLERVAQEYGDHPDLAIARMRRAVAAVAACAPPEPG